MPDESPRETVKASPAVSTATPDTGQVHLRGRMNRRVEAWIRSTTPEMGGLKILMQDGRGDENSDSSGNGGGSGSHPGQGQKTIKKSRSSPLLTSVGESRRKNQASIGNQVTDCARKSKDLVRLDKDGGLDGQKASTFRSSDNTNRSRSVSPFVYDESQYQTSSTGHGHETIKAEAISVPRPATSMATLAPPDIPQRPGIPRHHTTNALSVEPRKSRTSGEGSMYRNQSAWEEESVLDASFLQKNRSQPLLASYTGREPERQEDARRFDTPAEKSQQKKQPKMMKSLRGSLFGLFHMGRTEEEKMKRKGKQDEGGQVAVGQSHPDHGREKGEVKRKKSLMLMRSSEKQSRPPVNQISNPFPSAPIKNAQASYYKEMPPDPSTTLHSAPPDQKRFAKALRSPIDLRRAGRTPSSESGWVSLTLGSDGTSTSLSSGISGDATGFKIHRMAPPGSMTAMLNVRPGQIRRGSEERPRRAAPAPPAFERRSTEPYFHALTTSPPRAKPKPQRLAEVMIESVTEATEPSSAGTVPSRAMTPSEMIRQETVHSWEQSGRPISRGRSSSMSLTPPLRPNSDYVLSSSPRLVKKRSAPILSAYARPTDLPDQIINNENHARRQLDGNKLEAPFALQASLRISQAESRYSQDSAQSEVHSSALPTIGHADASIEAKYGSSKPITGHSEAMKTIDRFIESYDWAEKGWQTPLMQQHASPKGKSIARSPLGGNQSEQATPASSPRIAQAAGWIEHIHQAGQAFGRGGQNDQTSRPAFQPVTPGTEHANAQPLTPPPSIPLPSIPQQLRTGDSDHSRENTHTGIQASEAKKTRSPIMKAAWGAAKASPGSPKLKPSSSIRASKSVSALPRRKGSTAVDPLVPPLPTSLLGLGVMIHGDLREGTVSKPSKLIRTTKPLRIDSTRASLSLPRLSMMPGSAPPERVTFDAAVIMPTGSAARERRSRLLGNSKFVIQGDKQDGPNADGSHSAQLERLALELASEQEARRKAEDELLEWRAKYYKNMNRMTSLEQENAQLRGTTPPKASPTQSMASSIATALFMTPRSRMTRHESRNPAKPVNEPTEEAIGKPSMDTLDALEADLEWAEDKTPSSQGSPQPKTKPKSPRALQMNEQ